MDESLITPRIEHEQALIQENVDRNLPRAIDHEFGSRLTEHGGRVVDKLPGPRFDTQIYTTLGVSSRGVLGNRRRRALEPVQ